VHFYFLLIRYLMLGCITSKDDYIYVPCTERNSNTQLPEQLSPVSADVAVHVVYGD
jgi:hypothetical protein